MDDLISRKTAIDAVDRAVTKEAARWSLQELPSADAIDARQCRECKYKAINKALEAMEQPEIVRCKDCKHRDPEDKKCDSGRFIMWQFPRDDDWFCADGERREG